MEAGASGSDAALAANPGDSPIDYFDIDAFLDDYVGALDQALPLDDINLDFSLPFPQTLTKPLLIPVSAPVEEAERISPNPPPQIEDDDFITPSVTESEYEGTAKRPSQRNAARTRARKASAKANGDDSGGIVKSHGSAAQRKHAAVQEKNRRAQQRFRERQKQRVADLEEEVAALNERLAAVILERDALAAGQINDAGALDVPGAQGAASVLVPRELPRPCDSGSLSESRSLSGTMLGIGAGATLSPRMGAPDIVLTLQDLCSMAPSTLCAHFQTMVKELARTVVEEAGTLLAEQRAMQLVDQILNLWQRVGECNPVAAKAFIAGKWEDAQQRGQPADERTPQIMRALGLNDRQKAEIRNLRRLFLQRIGSITAERSTAATPSLAAPPPFGGTSSRALAGHQLAARHAARHVTSSLQEEHTTVVEFETAVTRHVLAPPQVAQLLIQSYPWPPDVLSMATWVAAEEGDADALSGLATEAQARAKLADGGSFGKSGTNGQNPVMINQRCAVVGMRSPFVDSMGQHDGSIASGFPHKQFQTANVKNGLVATVP